MGSRLKSLTNPGKHWNLLSVYFIESTSVEAGQTQRPFNYSWSHLGRLNRSGALMDVLSSAALMTTQMCKCTGKKEKCCFCSWLRAHESASNIPFYCSVKSLCYLWLVPAAWPDCRFIINAVVSTVAYFCCPHVWEITPVLPSQFSPRLVLNNRWFWSMKCHHVVQAINL